MSAALEASIRAHQAQQPGIERSNIGGWHSKTDMLEWGGPAAAKLAEMAVRTAKRLSHFEGRDSATVEWDVRMWANVSPPGALNMSHSHPGVLWAAVLAGAALIAVSAWLGLRDGPGETAVSISAAPPSAEAAPDVTAFPARLNDGARLIPAPIPDVAISEVTHSNAALLATVEHSAALVDLTAADVSD